MDISSQSISHKVRHISACMISVLILIMARLAYLQIVQQHFLFIQSQKNFLRIEKILAPRGNILDVNGVLLATNRPSKDLYWIGTGSHSLTEQQKLTLQRICHITSKPLVNDQSLMNTIIHTERYSKELLLISDLSLTQLSQIEEQLSNNSNLRITSTFKRHYPQQSIACHIIGYLSSIDYEAFGKMGIEKICEANLKGHEGSRLKTINSFGTSLTQTELNKGMAGQDIYTTIDFELQKIAESIFPEHKSGILLLMDPTDGAIRALVSRPDFDPEFFLHRFSQEE